MKVIFLDHDGVICLQNNWGSRFTKQKDFYRGKHKPESKMDIPIDVRFDSFDTKAILVLNRILEMSGAEIVCSSDWRYYATLDEMKEYYLSQGIIKGPIDFTPKTNQIEPEILLQNSSTSLEIERAFEIKYWLSKHPEVTHWVAVDDLNMTNGYYQKGLDNFVLTPKSLEGIKQSGVEKKILAFLN